MALFNNTRQQLRHMVADLCNDLITGTVADPASGSFVCEETPWQRSDDYFNDWMEVFCYYGTGVGTSGKPKTWTGSTNTLTFAPAVTLTSGDLVEMHRRFTVDEYNRKINAAIDTVAKEAYVYKVDASTTVVADTYAYDLPTAFVSIFEIEQESATSGVYDGTGIIDLRAIRFIPGSPSKFEINPKWFTLTADRHLRIKGYASPATLDNDAAVCPIDPTYVCNQAAALLLQSRIRTEDSSEQYQVHQISTYMASAGAARARLMTTALQGIPVIE